MAKKATDQHRRGGVENLGDYAKKGIGGPGHPKGKTIRTLTMEMLGHYIANEDEHYLKDWFDKFFAEAKDQETWQARTFADMVLSADMFDRYDEWVDRGERKETAFLRYQIHKRAHDKQRELLFATARQVFPMCGRRSGKTDGLKLKFADKQIENPGKAFGKPGTRCLYIGLTITKAMDLMWQPLVDLFTELGVKVKETHRAEGYFVLENGGLMQFGGNSTKEEREKNRGPWWDLIAIDEAQSQKDLVYLIESILEPTLIDTRGQLFVCGTGPRVGGTYWEALYLGQWQDGKPVYPKAFRTNFNLTDNPFIPDHEDALKKIREEKNLTESDPLYLREYMGKIAYDIDALVLRFTPKNHYTQDELAKWIASQPATDLFFSGGIDYGFDDQDSCTILLASERKPEKFTLYEYRGNREGTSDFANKIKLGIKSVMDNPILAPVTRQPNKGITFFCDTEGLGKKLTYDLASQYSLSVQPAYQGQPDLMLEMLQEEVRLGNLKVRAPVKIGDKETISIIEDEGRKIVFARNEQDQLTRRVDDGVFHPEIVKSVQYALRYVWLKSKAKLGGAT